jgi:hypothetical protein
MSGPYGTQTGVTVPTGAIYWPYDLPTPLFGRTHKFSSRGEGTEMASARLRWRRNHDEPIETIGVQWNFTDDQFARFQEFFDENLNNGEKVFILETYDQSAEEHMITVVTRQVAFLQPYKGNRDGNLHAVSATLVVESTDVYDTENWFDPFPPPPESHLPQNPTASFTSECRDEFTLTYGPEFNLQPSIIYGVEISDSQDGVFVPHIYFALQTTGELATGTKVLTINNDYNGRAWLRLVNVTGGYMVLTQPINPAASALPAPVIQISNLSEITTQDMIAAWGSAATGLYPLWSDDNGSTNFFTPLSYIEDKMIWLSGTYRRASKKYVQKQGYANSNDKFGDLLTELPAGVNVITALNQPAGASFVYSRDQSDPQIDTYMPRLQSLDLNVQAQDHLFQGVVKARYFKDGCRSPLCTVLIDKIMREIPTIGAAVSANNVSGYCDYPVTDSITGLVSESGNSCNILWGGDCLFENRIVGFGWGGGSLAENRWSPSTLQTSLRRHVKSLTFKVYLGWPIDLVTAQYWSFSSFDWFNRDWNGWTKAPKTHNWAITNTPAFNIYPIGFQESVCGADLDAQESSALFMASASLLVSFAMPPPPTVGCNGVIDMEIAYSVFNILRATQWKTNSRDAFWFESDDPFTPPVPTLEPGGKTPSVFPFDDFETYLEGDATLKTLDFNNGIDWDAAWTVRNGADSVLGWDLWESYTVGALPEYAVYGDYDIHEYLNDGEGWEAGVGLEWNIREGELQKVYSDTLETYSNGAVAFASMTGGTGWEAGGYWIAQLDTIGGDEQWEGYLDGAFVGANTGTNMIAEAWQAR